MTPDAPRPPRQRIQRRPLHGVLLLDKPLGLSSNDALQRAKRLLRAEKAGHTGTLDPLATGVLPLCFGAATKFSGLHLDADKTYEATLQLGVTTTTGDAEGEVTERRAVPAITPEQLEAVRQRFLGRITQVPPMHSALKKDGKALYEYARAGIEVERAPREVEIHALNLALAQVDQAQAAIKIEVTCSKGTYIRTLGEDIGQALGCGGHLTRLRRTATGPFVAAQCTTLPAPASCTACASWWRRPPCPPRPAREMAPRRPTMPPPPATSPACGTAVSSSGDPRAGRCSTPSPTLS
mgnify:CR=1 FL=1